MNLDDDLLFAVKSTSIASPSAPELLAIESELSILRTLNSPCILSFLGSDISSDNGVPSRNLFLEYMEGGSVAELARKSGGRLDESRVRRFTRSIVEGLAYLHEHEIVHCDIKGQNILVGSSGVKIADFGASKRLKKSGQNTWKPLNPGNESAKRFSSGQEAPKQPLCGQETAQQLNSEQESRRRPIAEEETEEPSTSGTEETGKISPTGTPLWMAPEVLRGTEQGFASDVWSLGCTVVEMIQGSPPWTRSVSSNCSLEHLLFKIACTEEDLPLPQDLSEECRDFLSKCLQRDPRMRWSASELLRHPFLLSEPSSHLSSPSLDDQFRFCEQPQPSPRSTLDFQVTDSESSDDDDRCSDKLTEDGDEDESSSWRCGFPSLVLNSASLCSPSVIVPRHCDWITVRRTEEDMVMNQEEEEELEGEAAANLPFMADSSDIILKKGCEVNLDCLGFLLQRRMQKDGR